MLASIFEDEGLFDERPCERGCRSANAKYFAGKALIIWRLAGREASEQSIPEQGVVPWNVNTFGYYVWQRGRGAANGIRSQGLGRFARDRMKKYC
jgi:hypothetical protein